MTLGFLVSGPLSGHLSDEHGARYFSTGGMLISAIAFAGLLLLPADFAYIPFALLLFALGIGAGTFAAPNTASIMNSVPPEHRGASSGMRATFQNVATSLSMTLVFSLVIAGLSANLPASMYGHLTAAGIPNDMATQLSHIPPIGALFAAFLGYNPMTTLIPAHALAQLPAATRSTVLNTSFFPKILAGPFMDGLRIVFIVCVLLSLAAAAASWMRGRRYIHELEVERAMAEAEERQAEDVAATGAD